MHEELHNYIRVVNEFLVEHLRLKTDGMKQMPLRVNSAICNIFLLLTGVNRLTTLPSDIKQLGPLLSSIRFDVAKVIDDYNMTTAMVTVDGKLLGRLIDRASGTTMTALIYTARGSIDIEVLMDTNPITEVTLH